MHAQLTFLNRAFGPYSWAYWTMVSCNVLVPQAFWVKRIRTSPWAIFFLSLLIAVPLIAGALAELETVAAV